MQEMSHFELILPDWSEAPSINLASAKKGRVGRLAVPCGKESIARGDNYRLNLNTLFGGSNVNTAHITEPVSPEY